MPDEWLEWKLVFETGWTLEYVRSLKMTDMFDFINIIDAKNKAGVR